MLLAMTEPWVWWLSFAGFPLTVCGILLRSFSARRSGWHRLGRESMRLGLGCLVMAVFFAFGLPAIDEAIRGLPLPGSPEQ